MNFVLKFEKPNEHVSPIMSSSTNGLKSGGLTIAFSKLSKPNEDQLEMNSINSTILLNPSAIKNNHPVINQLYTPMISQRSDAIDLNSISIPTFPSNINQLLLANSFQSLQPNKYHVRTNLGSVHAIVPNSNKNRTNDFNRTLNGQQQSVISFNNSVSSSASATSTSSSNSYMSNSIRLTNELSATMTPINKPPSSSSNLEMSVISSVNKQSNQQVKRSRLGSGSKSFVYSDKSAVDSVKKLDKIILNHNKNLQEIIKHKNQLIKTITAKQSKQSNPSNELIQSSQFSLNSLKNMNHQLNFQNTHLNSLTHLNNHIQSNIHQTNHQLNHQLNHQMNNQLNHQLNQQSNHQMNHINTNNHMNQLIFNNANNKSNKHQPGKHHQFNNQPNKQINKRLCWKNDATIDLLNNSLSVLTRAMNEEAELNKQIANQKRLMSQQQTTTKNGDKNHTKHNTSNKMRETFDLNELIANNEVLMSGEFGCTSLTDSFDHQSHSYDTFIKQSNLAFDGLLTNVNYLMNESSIGLNSSVDSSISPPAQPIISKLDERESRKKKLNDEQVMCQVFYYDDNGDIYELDENDCSGDEISDCENEEEYDYRLKAHSIIFNTARSSPNLTKEKTKFLHSIGLTTDEHKTRLEFDKLVKSKRTLKEINNTNNSSNKPPAAKRKRTLRKQANDSSVSQIIETVHPSDNDPICNLVKSSKKVKTSSLGDSMEIFNKFVQTISTRKVEYDHLEPTKVQPDQVRDPLNPVKQSFMNQIGLELECDVENIKSRELNWDGCLEDRERRKIFDTCFEKLTDNLEPLTKQNWLTNLNERTLNGVRNSKKFASNLIQPTQLTNQLLNHNLNQLHSNLTTDTSTDTNCQLIESVDLSSLRECFQASQNKSSTNSGEKVNKSNRSSPSVNSKSSLQNSVSKQSLDNNLLVAVNRVDTPDSMMNKQIEPYQSDHSYKWPGVEAVIQSYHDYYKQLQNEKVTWSKRMNNACQTEQELSQQKEKLNSKRESLVNDMKDVKDDYQQLSLAIESLVSWLKSVK